MTLLFQSRIVGISVIVILCITSILYIDAKSQLKEQHVLSEKVSEIVIGIFKLNQLTYEHLKKKIDRTRQQWEIQHAELTNILLVSMQYNDELDTITHFRNNLSEVQDLFFKIIVTEKLAKNNTLLLLKSLESQLNITTYELVSDASILGRKTQAKLLVSENNLERLLITSIIIITILILLIIFWVQKSLLNRIFYLRNSSLALIQGDYNAKFSTTANDELADLSHCFDKLSLTISQKIAEASYDWTWQLDESLIITYLSEGYEKFTGVAVSERIGLNISELISTQSTHQQWDDVLATMKARQPFKNIEITLETPSKKIAYINSSGNPIYDKDGIFRGYRGSVTDITERKLSEDLNQQFYKVIEHSLNEIYMFDSETLLFINVNKGGQKNLGYSIDELKNMTPLDIKPQMTTELFTKMIEPLKSGKKEIIQFETVHQRKDGKQYPVDVHLQLVSQGKPIFVAVILDITERKLAKEKLNKTLKYLEDQKSILDHHAIVTITDMTGKITYANKKFTDLSGYSNEELIGSTHRIINSGHHSKEFFTEIWQTISSGNIWQGEICNKSKDGSIYWVLSTLAPLLDNKGKINQYTAIRSDITEIKKTEELLRRAQKMEAIGELTGGIAHDFNNLLGIIIGNHDLMKRKMEDGSKLQKQLNSAQSAALRGADITRRLLQFSRQEEELHSPINISQVIEGFKEFISKSITASITLDVHYSDNLWLIDLDPNDFQDSILNLALNARDAMPSGGNLTIEAENMILDHRMHNQLYDISAGEYVKISVSDSGSGIKKRIVNKIFDPFFTTKDKSKGTGLGLAMVFGFVKRCNGSIVVYSEEGEGTTFKMYLPRTKTKTDKLIDAKQDTTPLPQGNETILIVDDEKELAEIASNLLEGLGYTTYCAYNAKVALEMLKSIDTIDMVFSDVVMPGAMNGYDLAREIVVIKPNIKILLTSGFTGNMLKNHIDLKLKETLLTKPYRDQELAGAIRNMLDA